MIEALFWVAGVVGMVLFAPRRGGLATGPQWGFPWVAQGTVVSGWSLAGTVLVLLPLLHLAWHAPAMRPLAFITGGFVLWVLWAWGVCARRRR